MATKTVLQNIHYYFVQVVQNAETKEDWDHDSIKKALKWATYCTEIYNRSCNRPFKKEFEEVIRHMLSLDIKWKGGEIDITMLRDAPNLLCQILLKNKFLSRPLKLFVLNAYLTRAGKNNVAKELADVTNHTAIANLSKKLNPTIPLKLIIDTASLLQIFQNADDDSNKAMKIQTAVSTLAAPNITALLQLVVSEDLILQSQSKLILEWIEKRFWEYDIELIAKQPPDLLAQISGKSKEFLFQYLNFLENQVNKFEPQYTQNGYKWKSDDLRFTYDDIVNYFSSLCEKTDPVKDHVEKLLFSKCIKEKSSIWFDISFVCTHNKIHFN